MFKAMLMLMLAGAPPFAGVNQKESFPTMAACEKALPRLEAEAVKLLKPRVRGKDYDFKMGCISEEDLKKLETKKKDDTI